MRLLVDWAMSADTYARWAAGLCPCCGLDIEPCWSGLEGEITEPAPLAEGVMLCGRCVANEHLTRPGLEADGGRAMLEAIARRTDEPLERLLPGSYRECRR